MRSRPPRRSAAKKQQLDQAVSQELSRGHRPLGRSRLPPPPPDRRPDRHLRDRLPPPTVARGPRIPPGEHRLEERLFFTTYYLDLEGHESDNGFDPILHGEVWRLVTPIFMHGNILHIFFNMWWLSAFGTMIEVRRGTLRLAGLVLIAAIISNIGQHFYDLKGLRACRTFPGLFGRRLRPVRLHLDERTPRARTGDGRASQHGQHHDAVAGALHDRHARADRQRGARRWAWWWA